MTSNICEEIKKMNITHDGNDWNKFVPEVEIRKFLFKMYLQKYPLAHFDIWFMKKHEFLLNDKRNGHYCRGCWDCCARLDTIDYNLS